MLTEELTIAVLTFNEASRLRRLLTSLPLPCRVLILDSESTDGTPQMAAQIWQELGQPADQLHVEIAKWEGFVRARNRTLALVKTPWIFWLDADEWLNPQLKTTLQDLKPAELDPNCIYQFSRLSHFMNQPIRHGGWYPDLKDRLASTQVAEWTQGPHAADVHEQLRLKVLRHSRQRLAGDILHEPFRDRLEQSATNDRYSSLLAEALLKQIRAGKMSPPPAIYVWIKPLIKFVENYFWKLGCLDGVAGFWIAIGSSQSMHWRMKKVLAGLGNIRVDKESLP